MLFNCAALITAGLFVVSLFGNLCPCVRFYKDSWPLISLRHHSYDPDGKTTVQILNKNVEWLMIDSYSQVTTL